MKVSTKPGKKPYRAPRLSALGGVARLTRLKSNAMGKADNPVDNKLKEMS